MTRIQRCGREAHEADPRDELLELGVPFATFVDQSTAWCHGYLIALREFESSTALEAQKAIQ